MDDTKTQEAQAKSQVAQEATLKGNSAENSGDGLIPQANAAAERLERANAEQKALLEKQEQMIAQARLGGRSEAGYAPIAPKEETPQEYAHKLLHGKIQLQ